MITPDEKRKRAVAAFIRIATGDAPGATAEFMTPAEIASIFGTLQDDKSDVRVKKSSHRGRTSFLDTTGK